MASVAADRLRLGDLLGVDAGEPVPTGRDHDPHQRPLLLEGRRVEVARDRRGRFPRHPCLAPRTVDVLDRRQICALGTCLVEGSGRAGPASSTTSEAVVSVGGGGASSAAGQKKSSAAHSWSP
jgi:hypothetical protein